MALQYSLCWNDSVTRQVVAPGSILRLPGYVRKMTIRVVSCCTSDQDNDIVDASLTGRVRYRLTCLAATGFLSQYFGRYE